MTARYLTPFLLVVFAAGCGGKAEYWTESNDSAPTTRSPAHDEVLQVRAGWAATCAVRSNGQVWCWGAADDNSAKTPYPIDALHDVTAVDVSPYPYGLCALHGSGGVTCLELVDGALLRHDVEGVGTGHDLMVNGWFSGESCVHNSDDTVSCWSNESSSAAGDVRQAEVVEGLDGVASLVRGAPCALRHDGTLWCWSHLGEPNGTARPMLGLTGLRSASFKGGGFQLLAVDTSGTIWRWDPAYQDGVLAPDQPAATAIATVLGAVEIVNNIDNACVLTDAGRLWCSGRNDQGQLGLGWADDTKVEELTLTSIASTAQIAVGLNHMCGVDQAGQLACWGSSEYAGFGAPPQTWDNASSVFANAVDLSVGDGTTCAVDGARALHCWGRNSHGQLGNAAVAHANAPQRVDGISDVVSVVNGWDFGCALNDGGEVWCWGDNAGGQLGIASSDEMHTPQHLWALSDVVAIGAGGQHACALTSEQQLWCWGNDQHGQLGRSGNGSVPGPVASLGQVTSFALGAQHTCAIDDAGQTWCWGRNYDGQVSDAADTQLDTPQLLPAVPAATKLYLGGDTSCAADAFGGLLCWGAADNAHHDFAGQTTAVVVTDTRICVANDADELVCWGPYEEPHVEMLNSGVTKLAAARHSCVLDTSGAVSCIGANGHGQLGDARGFLVEATPLQLDTN